MYHLRNRRKTYLTTPVPRQKRTKNLRKLRIIPSDVLMEIFKWLPSKDLMRLRCVSKTWNLVIRDPPFVKLHQSISQVCPSATRTILMGCIRPGRKLYFYKINRQERSILDLTIDNKFLDSINTFVTEIVNGLVCLWRFGNVMVCNISTHEIISLPPQPPNCLDLYPIYSLGYDTFSEEYKVLCIWSRSGFCKCTVFTIGKSTEWREVIHPLHCDLVPKASNSVFYRDVVFSCGSLYWLTQSFHGQKRKLVRFYVRKETFEVNDIPAALVLGVGLKLVNIGADLALFACGSNVFILEDFQNRLWVESNFHVPSHICPIGSTQTCLIYRQNSHETFAFDPYDGLHYKVLVYGEGRDTVENSIGSLLYRAQYSICSSVENIYPLRQI